MNTHRLNRMILALSLVTPLLGVWIGHLTIAWAQGGPPTDDQVRVAEQLAKDAPWPGVGGGTVPTVPPAASTPGYRHVTEGERRAQYLPTTPGSPATGAISPGATQPRIGTKAGPWLIAGGVTRTEQLSSIPPGFKHANIPGPDDSKNVPCTFRHQTQGALSSRYVGAADAPACPVKVLHEKNSQYRYVEPDRPPNTPPDWVHAKEDGLDYSSYVHPAFKHEKGGQSHSRYLFKVPPAVQPPPTLPREVQPPPTLPPGTKHAKEPGPFFSKPVAESWFHANRHGPTPGQDLFSHYLPPRYKHETSGQLATMYLPGTVPPAVQQPTKHAPEKGPEQSKHVPAHYKHTTQRGLTAQPGLRGSFPSQYVPPDWKHMKKGKDQSGYAPPTYKHVTEGTYKSHYVLPAK